jgi:phosphotransferase system IIB component
MLLCFTSLETNVSSFFLSRLNEVKGQLRSGNASVQQVVIGTFQDESDLETKLFREIEKALVSNV